MIVAAPSAQLARLCLGVTGHRDSHAAFVAHGVRIEAVLGQILDQIDAVTRAEPVLPQPTRLHSLLADGTDQMAATAAIGRGWDLVAVLPFGSALNVAINAGPTSVADAQALLRGEKAADEPTNSRAAAIHACADQAQLFELADQDDALKARFLAKLMAPDDHGAAHTYSSRASERVALAGRVMIEQSDIIIGVWDGVAHSAVGGTGHTIAAALEMGAAVIWIDARAPEDWSLLRTPESLVVRRHGDREERDGLLASLVRAALRPPAGGLRAGAAALNSEAWHPRSSRWWTAYRRVEALFGGDGRPFRSLVQHYERPDEIARGSAAPPLDAARSLPESDKGFVSKIESDVLRRFAWSDGISAHLSDSYRGGMIANFILSVCAILVGMAYQPFATAGAKWMFASVELVLLCAILGITWLGGRKRWHGRWFETRRVAEYFRHAPILLVLGVARAPGRWPKGSETSWPEYYARAGLREVGLPTVKITAAYLRAALATLLDPHIVSQRDYHLKKAVRLAKVHHNLDILSTRLFVLAVISVFLYLLLKGAATTGLVPHDWPHQASYGFTFLGVAFPTLGGALSGIRYFGDFERFAAISRVTAEKLDVIHARVMLLLSAPDDALDYARASELAHAADDVVVSEIENWQAVFGGKHITVPV